MQNQAGKKRTRDLPELINDARSGASFLSIKPNINNKASTAVITGHKTVWGNGVKSRPDFVYIPGLALAGSLNDVTNFVKVRISSNTMTGDINIQEAIFNGMITKANHTDTTKRLVAWLFPIQDQDPANTEARTTDPVFMETQARYGSAYKFYSLSPMELFNSEMAKRAKKISKNDETKGEPIPSLGSIIDKINGYLVAFGLTPEVVPTGVSSGVTSVTKGSETPLEAFKLRLNKIITEGKGALLIMMNSNSNKPHVKITNAVGNDGFRLTDDPKSELYNVYFKRTASGNIPEYVNRYLHSIYDTNSANQWINSINERITRNRVHEGLGGMPPGQGNNQSYINYPQPLMGQYAQPLMGQYQQPLPGQLPQGQYQQYPQLQPGQQVPQGQYVNQQYPPSVQEGYGLPPLNDQVNTITLPRVSPTAVRSPTVNMFLPPPVSSPTRVQNLNFPLPLPSSLSSNGSVSPRQLTPVTPGRQPSFPPLSPSNQLSNIKLPSFSPSPPTPTNVNITVNTSPSGP